MKIKYAFISKTGRRSKNEDYVKVMDKSEEFRWLGIVCDGMGGHAMGDVASETVCNEICNYWEQHNGMDAVSLARKACHSASVRLDERSYDMHHVEMATTLVMADITEDTITITHCGDSRCYLMREGEVVYETKDHLQTSFGWEYVANCFYSFKPEVAQPEIAQFKLKAGDRILICSDGIYKSIPPQIQKARMMDDKSPEEILDVFDFLCDKNGDDNYSAIIAFVE